METESADLSGQQRVRRSTSASGLVVGLEAWYLARKEPASAPSWPGPSRESVIPPASACAAGCLQLRPEPHRLADRFTFFLAAFFFTTFFFATFFAPATFPLPTSIPS